MDTGPNLGIMYNWDLAAFFKDDMDANLKYLDAVIHLHVISNALTAPPGSPAAGDRYIVGASATGAWSTHDGQIAVYVGTTWEFHAPKKGWAARVENDLDANSMARVYAYDGSAWKRPKELNYDAQVVLTDAATIAVDAALGLNKKVTLGGNRTLGNPTNLVAGMTLKFSILQDSTGSRTLAFGNLYKFEGGTPPVASTAANAVDYLEAYYNGTILQCRYTKAYA